MNVDKIHFWDKFRGIGDREIETLAFLTESLYSEQQKLDDYYQYVYVKTHSWESLSHSQRLKWELIKERVENYGFDYCRNIVRIKIEHLQEEICKFINNRFCFFTVNIRKVFSF